MKTWKSWFFLCLIFAAFAAISQAEEMHLKDGTVLQGLRVGEEDTVVVFRTNLGDVRVPASQIIWEQDSTQPAPLPSASAVASLPTPEKGNMDPSHHALVLMPTAFTQPQGTLTFEDFELLFLTFSYALTNTTAITVGAFFPVDPSDLESYTVGLKQQLAQSPDGRFALAVTGDYTFFTGDAVSGGLQGIWTANLVGSLAFGDTNNDLGGIHVALGDVGFAVQEDNGIYNEETGTDGETTNDYNAFSFAAGFDARLTPNLKFIGEFLSAGDDEDENDENLSVVNFGFRIHGDHLSVDLCGIRPLGVDTGNLFLYPMINVGYKF